MRELLSLVIIVIIQISAKQASGTISRRLDTIKQEENLLSLLTHSVSYSYPFTSCLYTPPHFRAILPLLFLLTISLSQFTFFLGMKSFPNVLPDSCPHEDMETRVPSHSWLDLSSRGGTHALGASILTADIFLLAGKIHPFLYSTGFVTPPQSHFPLAKLTSGLFDI